MHTALFLPGLLNDRALWEHQIHHLRDLVNPVVADLTRDTSIEAMAERALTEVSGPFILISLSMGGYVAFEILRMAQERVLAAALMSTSASPDTSERKAERQRAIASLEHGRFQGVTDRFLPRLIHASRMNNSVGIAVRQMARRVGQTAFLNQQRAILERRDYQPILDQISIPCLVSVGDNDQLTPPREAGIISNGVAQSRFHLFKGCGHLPPMECPQESSQLLRSWISETCLHTGY